MDVALQLLAFLGAVLVGLAVNLVTPDTAEGHAIVFLAFGAALYPLARLHWFASLPVWRYWVGLGFGALLGWMLDSWRRNSLTTSSSQTIGAIVIGLLTAALIMGLWWEHRKSKRIHQ